MQRRPTASQGPAQTTPDRNAPPANINPRNLPWAGEGRRWCQLLLAVVVRISEGNGGDHENDAASRRGSSLHGWRCL
jgi:hypothetical protein